MVSINKLILESLEKDWSQMSSSERRHAMYNDNKSTELSDEEIEMVDSLVDKYSAEIVYNFENESEANEFLTGELKQLKLLPDKVTLYRIVALNDIEELKKDDLGIHFTDNKDYLREEEFLYSIGIDMDKPHYTLTVEVNRDDIDFERTLIHKLLNPIEFEITLKKSAKPKIIKVDK